MKTTVTIEPSSVTYFSNRENAPYSVSFSTTIPLEISVSEAWEIIEGQILPSCYPDVRLDTITEDLGLECYCFSVTGMIKPEALEVTIDV